MSGEFAEGGIRLPSNQPCLDAALSSVLSFLSPSPSSWILLAMGLDTYSLLMSKVVLLNGDMDEYMLA